MGSTQPGLSVRPPLSVTGGQREHLARPSPARVMAVRHPFATPSRHAPGRHGAAQAVRAASRANAVAWDEPSSAKPRAAATFIWGRREGSVVIARPAGRARALIIAGCARVAQSQAENNAVALPIAFTRRIDGHSERRGEPGEHAAREATPRVETWLPAEARRLKWRDEQPPPWLAVAGAEDLAPASEINDSSGCRLPGRGRPPEPNSLFMVQDGRLSRQRPGCRGKERAPPLLDAMQLSSEWQRPGSAHRQALPPDGGDQPCSSDLCHEQWSRMSRWQHLSRD